MKKSVEYTVQDEIAVFFVKALYLTVMPLNIIIRPELAEYFIIISSIVLLLSIFSIILTRVIKKSQFQPGTKLLLYSTLLSILFCTIALTSVKLNELLWATLIINVMLSIFLIKYKHIIFIQLLSYTTLSYLIVFGGLSHLMLTQRITVMFFLFVSSTVSMAARGTIFLLIDKLIKKSELLEVANEDMLLLNNELELKVLERTQELQIQNDKLEVAMLKLEKAQESLISNKSMESFLSITRGISHQMNTPLGVILTSTSYLEDELNQLKKSVQENTLSKTQLEKTIDRFMNCEALISDNVESSIKIVDALKRYSGMESNREESLLQVIRNFKTYYVKNTLNKSIVINIIAPNDLKYLVPEYTFVQVLELIIENSVNYSVKTSVNIDIEVTNEKEGLVLMISDDGPGIEDHILGKVFEPYFSTNPHRLGMGLFIVENFISYTLKGKIEVKNGKEHGVIVKIAL